MAIERLSFPEYLNIQAGIEIRPDNLPEQLRRILKRFGMHARRLEEGEYDLTAPIWRNHVYVYDYNLTVLDSGVAIMRLLPRHADSYSGMLDHKGLSGFRVGGRVINIPGDEPMVVVAGPNRLVPSICLYEVIYHVNGSNPSQS